MKYAKKSLGQNFLNDLNIIKKIVSLKDINDKNVLEIGPGKGALTDLIIQKKPKFMTLIEKDDILYQNLKFKYRNIKNLKILNEDVLKFDFEKHLKSNSVVFGNLPYNISSQILISLIRLKVWPPKYSDLIFMFQKEMGERIIGKFDTPKYGRLSILTSLKLKIEYKFHVSPNCFTPKPKIDSTVIHFKPNKKLLFKIKDIRNLEKVTQILFSNKRKMINKNIKKILKPKELNSIKNLNLNSRPSDLRPEKYYEITELFEKM